MNIAIVTSQQLLQSSTQSIVGIFFVAGIIIMAYLWLVKNQKSDSDATENSVAIKIDRNGKHRYEVIPNSGNSNLKLWMKIIIAVIALAFLWIPIKSLLNPQY